MKNLHIWKVSDDLYRGAMPSESHYAALKQMGIRTVINVRRRVDTREIVERSGMRYIAIPILAWDTKESEIIEFLSVMKDADNHPVYVHCAEGGDRSGMLHGVYRVVYQNWSNAEAACEMAHGGYLFHPAWQNNLRRICDCDGPRMRNLLDLTDEHVQPYAGDPAWWPTISCRACPQDAKPGILNRINRRLRLIFMIPLHGD